MKASTRGLVGLLGLIVILTLAVSTSWAQMIPAESSALAQTAARTAEATSGRTPMDNGELKILFVRPWARVPETGSEMVFFLRYWVGKDFQLDEGQHVLVVGSSDDEIGDAELKIAEVTEFPDPGKEGVFSLFVNPAQLNLLQGLGRGNLVVSLVEVDAEGKPVKTEDQKQLIGDMGSICTGYNRNPVDLRIITRDDNDAKKGLENVDDADLPLDYLVDADSDPKRSDLEQAPATEVPELDWDLHDQCKGEFADLANGWINEVKLSQDDSTEGGPSQELRCSVNRVAFDIWYVEDPTLEAADVAAAIDSIKIKDPLLAHSVKDNTGFFRLYTSPLTTKHGDHLSSLDPSTNLPNEVGELGDPIYGVWGYWGNAPLSKNLLYNMVARIERKGLVRLENRVSRVQPSTGGRLFVYVYDPGWYGVRWVADTTQWHGHLVKVDGFSPQVQDGHIAYDTDLANNVLLLDGSPKFPGYELHELVTPDTNPAAGSDLSVTINASDLGNCGTAVAAVVTYEDPNNDVDVSAELDGKKQTSHEARLEVLNSRVSQDDETYRGVYKIETSDFDHDLTLDVRLPSSVNGKGTIHVLLIPWQQVEDGKLESGTDDRYAVVTAGLRKDLRIYSERSRALDITAVTDVGFNYTEETFPWPDPFFQKNDKQYQHQGVQLFNAGTVAAEVTYQVLLVKDSAPADVCTAEVEASWGQVLATKTLSMEATHSETVDIDYKLTDLQPDENRIVIRLLQTGDGQNMPLRCVEKSLVHPLPLHGLQRAYTVYGAAGDSFSLILRTAEGGPGFKASVELVPDQETPEGEVVSDQDEVEVPDTSSYGDTKTAKLSFAIAGGIDALISRTYHLKVTSRDLYADPWVVDVPVSVDVVSPSPDAANPAEMTVLPVAAALPGVGSPWRTAAWLFNQQDFGRTYEVGYVFSRDTDLNNGSGNLFTASVKDRAMTVARHLTLSAKGRPDSLVQYDDILDELFGVFTRTKGWIYVKPVKGGAATAQDPWPSRYPMVAEEVYSLAEITDPESGETITMPRGQFVVARPMSWLATTPVSVQAPLVIPPPDGGQAISTRVNLHVTVFGDQLAHFRVVAYDEDGADHVVKEDLEVKAQAVAYLALPSNLRPARLEVEPHDSNDGIPYAVVVSQVDDGSDDPISFPGQVRGVLGSGGDRVVVPVIAHTSGQNGSRWYTDLTLANTGTKDASYTFRFFPEGGGAELPETPMAPQPLPAGTAWSIHDVVQELGHTGGNTKGLLLVELGGDGLGDVLVASRTYTVTTCETEDGGEEPCTYGQRVPGYAATPQILTAGHDAGVLFALDLGSGAMRENLGLVNVGDEPATVVLRLMDHTGQPLKLQSADGSWIDSQAVTVELDAHELHQQALDRWTCPEDRAPCVSSFFPGSLKAGQADRLQGCVLEVAAARGEITAYLTKVDNTSNDAVFVPVIQPQGYGTALPDSDRSELVIEAENPVVGAWEKLDLTLRDSNGRPLPGYPVTLASSRPYYFRFKGANDGELYPRWKITDKDGKASFEVTSHAPGTSQYHIQWAQRSTINISDESELRGVDLTTSDSCEWEVKDITSRVADESVVGRAETMTVTMKEADGSPVWPGLTVELASDRPEDSPSAEEHFEAKTDDQGVTTFTVGTTTIGLSMWHAALYDQVSKDEVGGESGTTIDDETLWYLDEAASTVVVADKTPAAGPTDGSDCNADGLVDAGDTLTVTATLMGENGQPVVNANALLNTSYGKDTILTEMPVVTDEQGKAVFQVEVLPVNGDVPVEAAYTATTSPNSGTSTDPVQTVGTDPDNTTEWQDESPAHVQDFVWTLSNGFLTEISHQLDFDAQECIGHVDVFDLTIQRQDDNRYWDPTSKTWVAGETWFNTTVQPQLDGNKPANTWNGTHSWDDLPQDMATRSNAEGFTVEWKVKATDGGGNEVVYSAGVQPVDYLAPEITSGFVSREGSGMNGALPLAGEGFDIWSTAREYNPASGASWYRLEGGGASGQPVPAPAAPISGSPDVTLEPVALSAPLLGGDQKFGALGANLVDQAGHDSGPVLNEAWAVFVRPLPAEGFFQDGSENPQEDQVGCGATGLRTLLRRNQLDPAVSRNSLQYAFLLDADASGDVSPGDYWLAVDGQGDRHWTAEANGPTYRDASGWGIGSGSWTDPLVLPATDDSSPAQPVLDVTQDHQVLVYAHNPMEGAEPVPGVDPNTVSDPVTVVTEGLPVIESFVLGDGDASLHECETGGLHGSFSDDDGQVAEVQILIESGGEYFDGAANQWVGTETWFTVSHDDAAHTWSWDVPHELFVDHLGETVEIRVRAIDNEEGSCTACQGEVLSCNTPALTATLTNGDPVVAFNNLSYPSLDDGQAITGTMSDTEFGLCGDDSGYTLELRIQAADTGQYWNGSSWQDTESWVSLTVFDWSAGTWSYTLPAGFHDTLGGSPLTVTARVTDDYGASTTADVSGDMANLDPTAGNDGVSTDEDTATANIWSTVLANDSDDSQPPLSITAVDSSGTVGLVSLNTAGTSLVYDPNGQFESLGQGDTATDTFTYTINDIHGGSSTAATVTVTINGVNDPPTTTGIPNQTNNDSDTVTLDVSGRFSDVEGDTLSFSASNLPGGLTINSATAVISGTIDSSASGSSPYSCSVTADDGNGGTVTASFTWTVANPAPTATPDSYSTNEDTALTVAAPGVLGNDSDVDGDALTAVLDAGVSHGTLTLNSDGSFTYTPATNYNGSDSFTYHANDGTADSATVTVSLTVNAVNDPPTTSGIADQTNNDSDTVTLDVSGQFSDPDGDTLTFSASNLPLGLSITSTGFIGGTISASASASSPYTSTVTADDGNGGTATASFTWTVTNPPPTVTVGNPTPFILDDGVSISGTATDDDTVTGVTLTIEDTDAGLYWDAITSTWSGMPSNNPATGTASWLLTLASGFHTATNGGHTIQVLASAADSQGVVGTSPTKTGSIAP